MKVKINSFAFRSSIGKQKEKIRPVIDENIIPALIDEKQNLIQEIIVHPVSEDLNRKEVFGENSLYGLIGFQEGEQDDPVDDLINLVDETTILPNTASSITVHSAEKIKAKYTIQITDQRDLDNDPRMEVHWGTQSNWVKLIEDGITGLEHFLRGTRFDTSRSGHGIQSEFLVRNETYPRRNYLTGILANFITRLNTNINNKTLTRFVYTTASGAKRLFYNVRNKLGQFRKL